MPSSSFVRHIKIVILLSGFLIVVSYRLRNTKAIPSFNYIMVIAEGKRKDIIAISYLILLEIYRQT